MTAATNTGYDKANGMMMFYAWVDNDTISKQLKFGEHFATGATSVEEAKKRVLTYLKRHQFPRRGGSAKYEWDSEIDIAIWDVSDYAAREGFNKAHAQFDNEVRKKLNIEKGYKGDEFHVVDFTEFTIAMSEHLTAVGQELPSVGLTDWQIDTAVQAIDKFNAGDKKILAELCARFGKTIWSSAVAMEMGSQLTVVFSYSLSVFSSFRGDLAEWEQFAHVIHINASDKNYKERVTAALNAGKQVFLYVSLCKGTKRQERIDFIRDVEADSKMVIIDEADFGAHQAGQALPLVAIEDAIDWIIIMTGTNSDRAATHWRDMAMISVTYPELLVYKQLAQEELATADKLAA